MYRGNEKRWADVGQPHERSFVDGRETPPLLPADDAVEAALPATLHIAFSFGEGFVVSLARVEVFDHRSGFARLFPFRGGEVEGESGFAEDVAVADGEVVVPEGEFAGEAGEGSFVNVDEALQSASAGVGGKLAAEEGLLFGRGDSARVEVRREDFFLDRVDVAEPPRELVRIPRQLVLRRQVPRRQQSRRVQRRRNRRSQRRHQRR